MPVVVSMKASGGWDSLNAGETCLSSTRLLYQGVYDVFKLSRTFVSTALTRCTGAPLQRLVHERRNLLPVIMFLEDRADEVEQLLDNLSRRGSSSGFDVHEHCFEAVSRGDPVRCAQDLGPHFWVRLPRSSSLVAGTYQGVAEAGEHHGLVHAGADV
jgi:hypothetical protein